MFCTWRMTGTAEKRCFGSGSSVSEKTMRRRSTLHSMARNEQAATHEPHSVQRLAS